MKRIILLSMCNITTTFVQKLRMVIFKKPPMTCVSCAKMEGIWWNVTMGLTNIRYILRKEGNLQRNDRGHMDMASDDLQHTGRIKIVP